MKFFTRDLYLRINSPGAIIADRADADWEEAVSAYHSHLGRFSETMNDRVRRFAEELCLHDMELLALQEAVLTSPTLPPTQTPVAIISLRGIGRIFSLFYLLWEQIILSTAPEAWPFTSLRHHWLYDEIDLDPEPSPLHRYYHHVLWSDGREINIPFYDVIVHSYSDKDPEPAVVPLRKS